MSYQVVSCALLESESSANLGRLDRRDSLNRQDALRAAAAAAADDASSSDDSDAPEQAKVPRFNELDRSRLIHA